MTFKSCKVIRNDKIVLNRLKLYLNIIGALSKPKLDLILSDVKDLYEIV